MSHGHLRGGAAASSRTHGRVLDQLDAGLRSIQGAETIINMIKNRRFVNRLIIGHNELGNDGCRTLFGYLNSLEGRRYEIQEISLNSNDIGDDGLVAIGEYLKDNVHLRELFLQNNALQGISNIIQEFTKALNTSRLELLSLTTNKDLSDTFLSEFLGLLDSPHLREIQISAIGLSPESGLHIANYLKSPRCRLHNLRCNGNALGLGVIRKIVHAIKGFNYSLRSIELYANQLQEDEVDVDSANANSSSGNNSSEDEDEDEVEDEVGNKVILRHIRTWKDAELLLKSVLLRNAHLRRVIGKQSLVLLRYSRLLLFEGKLQKHQENQNSTICSHSPSLSLVLRPEDSNEPELELKHESTFPFKSLPLELQLYTLSFIAPSLSSSQRIRVYNYATSPATLPQLLPPLSTLTRNVRVGGNLNGITCIPDPSSIEYVLGGTVWPINRRKNSSSLGSSCVDQCMGSTNALLCNRDKRRVEFWEMVGCDMYELEIGERVGDLREEEALKLGF